MSTHRAALPNRNTGTHYRALRLMLTAKGHKAHALPAKKWYLPSERCAPTTVKPRRNGGAAYPGGTTTSAAALASSGRANVGRVGQQVGAQRRRRHDRRRAAGVAGERRERGRAGHQRQHRQLGRRQQRRDQLAQRRRGGRRGRGLRRNAACMKG